MTEPATTARVIAQFLARQRVDLSTESVAQAEIARILVERFGDVVEREVRLGPGDRVDIMVGSVAVEVKVRASAARWVTPQVERYAAHARVGAIVIATARALSGVPAEIRGKPVLVVNLGRAWL